MQDRHDILIVDLTTSHVSSVASYSLRQEEVGALLADLISKLKPGLIAISRPAGNYRKGDAVEIDPATEFAWERGPEPPARKPRVAGGETYSPQAQQRIADGLCIKCGSPNLFTTRLCEHCNILNNAASAKSAAKTL